MAGDRSILDAGRPLTNGDGIRVLADSAVWPPRPSVSPTLALVIASE
jgi:hypothetical protein